MRLLGGRAHTNGVSFQSTSHIATGRRNNDKGISVNVRRLDKFTSRFGRIALKIPLFRGLYIVLQNAIRAWKLLLALAVVEVILQYFPWYLFLGSSPSSKWMQPLILIFMMGILVLFIKIGSMGKYHGAEHKVFNAFQNRKPITLEYVSQERRVSTRCGTNLLIFVILITLLLEIQPVFDLSSYSLLIGILVGYEIFRGKNFVFRKLLFPFYKIGEILQYYLFTSEPTAEQLEVAIQALKALELKSLAQQSTVHGSVP